MLDNKLIKLIIQILAQGMQGLAGSITTESGLIITTEGIVGLTTESGVDITTESGSKIIVDGSGLQLVVEGSIPYVAIQQGYQPTQEGPNTIPTLYLYKVGDNRLGSPQKKSKWTTCYRTLTTENGETIQAQNNLNLGIDGTQQSSMRHTEIQQYETTFQLSALATQNPANIMSWTASDILNAAAAILQSQSTISLFEAQGIGIYRIGQVRNPYFSDDRERYEAAPSLDFTLTHKQTIITTIPVVTETILQIDEV